MQQFRRFTLGISYFFNILLLFLLFFEDRVHLPAFLQVSGRMHPLVLHFPLTLLFVGIVLEYLGRYKSYQHPAISNLTSSVLYIFAISAAITALFGFFLYEEGTYLGNEVTWHKWLGVGVSLMGIPIVTLKETTFKSLYHTTLGISAICLILAGHLGAEVTHGKGFLTEPLRKRSEPVALVENVDSAVIFRDVIQPIMNEKCLNCHNANRAKGDLILSDYESMMKGGETRDGIVAGRADKSLLYKYISLPMEDTLHMPPKDKLQLDREEIRLIGWWINTGAHADTKYAALPKSDSIHPFMAARFHPKTGIDLLNIPFADYDNIKQLNNPYRTVQQISATKPYIAVFLGSKKDFTSKDLNDLGNVAPQVTSIDLGNSTVHDNDLKSVSQFAHVQKLYLQNSSVTDDGVKLLRDLRYLEVLNLSGTKVTSKILEEIVSWQQLKKIYVYNTAIADEAVTSLKNARKDMQIFSTQIDLADPAYDAALTPPVVKIDSPFFRTSATIDIKLSRGKVKYYYTLDGSEPTQESRLYTVPFRVEKSGELKVKAMMSGWKDSNVIMFPLMRLSATRPLVTLETKPDPKHAGKLDSTLVDGISGDLSRGDKSYLGFIDQDMQILFEFIHPTEVSTLTLSLLEDVSNGVFLPGEWEVWTGSDKNNLRRVSILQHTPPSEEVPSAKRVVVLTIPSASVSFVRLKARRAKTLPSWYTTAKKGKVAIFVDEVAVE